ncbi:MAG TPA: hypothetical protein VEH50_11565 [Methylomirabilota bacterium]|nr:hypothetical protein [Methylomirabilota bacterium]
MSNLDLRPLSLGEILDRTFTLYRRNFLLFVGIVGLPYLLMLAMELVQTFLLLPGNLPVGETTGPQQPPFSAPTTTTIASTVVFYAAFIVVAILVYLLAQGASVFAVSELYLGHTTTIRKSFQQMRGQMLRLFATVFLYFVLLAACFTVAMVPFFLIVGAAAAFGRTGAIFAVILAILLFFGGIFASIYLVCRFILVIPATLLEDAGPVTALRRSFALTRKNAGRAFLIILISVAITGAAAGVLMIPPYIGMLISLINHHFGMIRIWMALFQVGSFIGQALAGPILIIATAVFYFDLRVRKEALDLQMMLGPEVNPGPVRGGVPTMLS